MKSVLFNLFYYYTKINLRNKFFIYIYTMRVIFTAS